MALVPWIGRPYLVHAVFKICNSVLTMAGLTEKETEIQLAKVTLVPNTGTV